MLHHFTVELARMCGWEMPPRNSEAHEGAPVRRAARGGLVTTNPKRNRLGAASDLDGMIARCLFSGGGLLAWPLEFFVSTVRGSSDWTECRLTASEFSGRTRANARVRSAATRG